jgi:hypothetical protein
MAALRSGPNALYGSRGDPDDLRSRTHHQQCRTHGTMISLLVANKCGVDGFGLWKQLGLPSFVVVDLPAWDLATVVAEMPFPDTLDAS